MGRNARRYRPARRSGLSFIVVILLLAVASGYVGTKYVIYPYLLHQTPVERIITGADQKKDEKTVAGVTGSAVTGPAVTQEGKAAGASSQPGIISDSQEIKNVNGAGAIGKTTGGAADTGAAVSGTIPSGVSLELYAVQYGSFSTKEAAETASTQFLEKNIRTFVMAKEGSFKVFGLPYVEKAKAKEAATWMKPVVGDVYVGTVTLSFKDSKAKDSLLNMLSSYGSTSSMQDPGKEAVLYQMQDAIISIIKGLL